MSFVYRCFLLWSTPPFLLFPPIGFVEVKYNELDERTSDKLGFSGYYYMMKVIG